MHDSSTIVFSICPHYCSTPVLRAYTAIPGADIVRCLRETFDCLFAILDSPRGDSFFDSPFLGFHTRSLAGLGDSNYSKFCRSTRDLDSLLHGLGATRMAETSLADDAVTSARRCLNSDRPCSITTTHPRLSSQSGIGLRWLW